MSFMPSNVGGKTQTLQVFEDRSAPIAFIGDFTSRFDLNAGRALSGLSYNSFEALMHQADIIKSEVYFTNIFKTYVQNKETLWNSKKGVLTDLGKSSLPTFQEELHSLGANIFVCFGEAAFHLISGQKGVARKRGYIWETQLIAGRKCLGTPHPTELLHGNTYLRNVLAADLKKAKKESSFRELRRPERRLTFTYDTVQDALDWLDYYAEQEIVGFDIEVLNFEVACISFSSDPEVACVIPTSQRWTVEEELLIWRGIQKVLGNPNSVKVVQNGMFDIPFLANRNGIITRGPIHDTMIAHSIMYPELKKSLGFLGSLYCGSQEYWKEMVHFKSIKEED